MSFQWLDDITKGLATWGMSALGGIVLIIVGLVIARLVREALLHALRATQLDERLIGVIAFTFYYFTIAVVVIAAFGVMGIETASLITILGTCSLAIGLALQGSLSNLASGVMLFVFHPFRSGDFIETGEYKGYVKTLGLFSTELSTLQNVRVVVPNTYISQRPIENWSANEACRLDLQIEVAIGGELAKIRQSIMQMLADDGRILSEPAAVIGVDNFGDSSTRLVVWSWCKFEDYWRLRYELPEKIRTAVEAAGGAMPTPQREIVITRGDSA